MIGERIAHLRSLHKMSQKDLAEKIGVSKGTVKNWETYAAEPCASNIRSLCSIFNITSDFLLGLSDKYTLFHEDLDEMDYIMLSTVVQHTVNLKHKK